MIRCARLAALCQNCAEIQRVIGLDVFAGAGGMSLGAARAGVRVHTAVEMNPYASQTYRHNHPETTVLSCDIRGIANFNLEAANEQTVIFGGPPCKGFSTSNQRTRTRHNPDNWLFEEFIRVIRMMHPDWVVFENVTGILETDGAFFLDIILESIAACGYTLSYGILNAADFGVPQSRSRLFIIGSLHGVKVELPKPETQRRVTVIEAINDLPLLTNGARVCQMPYRVGQPSAYARVVKGGLKKSCNHIVTRNADFIIERYGYVPQGGNWEDIPARLMHNYANRERCHTGIYHRLHPDRPSKVIGNFRKNMVIHPHQDRGLSVREAARLQSFPDCYKFFGSIGFQQEQVGNAVPPLLAGTVFNAILNA